MNFLRWLMSLIGGAKSGPVPVPPAQAPPKPIEGDRMSDRVIDGGRAHITGIHEKGPQGPALKGDRLREVRDRGSNAPSDCWVATDCTPTDADGKEFGPMPKSEESKHYGDQTNPEMQGVTSWDGKTTEGTSGDHQVVRLVIDTSGLTKGTAELVHEGANHGCSGRVKCRDAEGSIGLSYEAANGVVIPFRPPTLNLGRQEGGKGSAGKSGGAAGG